MLRVTLAARLALIGLAGFAVGITVVLAVFYRTTVHENELTRPSPARLEALATLLERTRGDSRQAVLDAVSSPQFMARIVPGAAPASGETPPQQAQLREIYAAGLAGRPVEIVPPPDHRASRLFPRIARLMANAAEFRIGLRGGELLVIDAYTRLPVTPFGLPVGFGAGLFGSIVALLALLVMQRETRPLAQLAAAVDRVDLSADPPKLPDARRSAPEIRAVIAAFNRLQERLAEMLRARMTLVGGIAHDVRTFATRLRLRVEHIPDDAERQRAVADIDDMIRLLDDALLSARAGAGGLSQEMVELTVLIAVEVHDRHAQGKPVDLITDERARNVVVLGDRLALRRILANIIDNALAYGHAAHVRASLKDGAVIVAIDDDGPGIPADQRQAVLEPFHRLEQSRNRATGGAGLGLAVVRSLVEAHGGTIDIAAAPGGGTRVNVVLPVFRPA
ncbi:sensor histidine kinase [Bradyrhizobium sp. GCM10027634]|uniref:sensor histidine kinase n=1 Tax=unclassified Bradyrhizobium TaxID=2631580 RepID=UPI00188D01FB|nr:MULTISPECIES: ATP-binding protein [unclassified Bradyrhizobium]MDN5000529.1 ATP-binding protein [Bradyrhizobium sp. WYCCWR 12677]QOZ42725.1 histidine kinase [Bradyrhizobium sp. CCBAU 53340]